MGTSRPNLALVTHKNPAALTLNDLSHRINTAVIDGLKQRVQVGRWLRDARERLTSNQRFGDWCRDNLSGAIGRSRKEVFRFMRVAEFVDDHRLSDAALHNLGWTNTLFACTGNARAQRAIVDAASKGALTRLDVLKVLKKHRQANADHKAKTGTAPPTAKKPAYPAPAPVRPTVTLDALSANGPQWHDIKGGGRAVVIPRDGRLNPEDVVVAVELGWKLDGGYDTLQTEKATVKSASLRIEPNGKIGCSVNIDADEILRLAKIISAGRARKHRA